jgi:hypothetical protein
METYKSVESTKKRKTKIDSFATAKTGASSHTNHTSKQKTMCSIRMIQMSKPMGNICLTEGAAVSTTL